MRKCELGAIPRGLEEPAGAVEVGAADEDVEVLGVPLDPGVARERIRAADEERQVAFLHQAHGMLIELQTGPIEVGSRSAR